MARPRSPYSAPTQTLGTPNSTQRRAGLNTTVMKPKPTGSVVTPQYAPQAAPATPYSPRSTRAPSSYGEFQAAPQMHAPPVASGAMDAPAFQPHDIQPYPQQSAPSMGAPRPAPSRLPLNNFTPATVTGPYGDTSQVGPAGLGISGSRPPRQAIPVSRTGQFSAPSVPPTQNYGLPDDMAASLRQQAGTFAPTASPANPGTVPLGSYGGVNSYNTPNVNTYVAPGGRFASGLGNNTPGLAGQIEAHQHQQMLNGLSPSDAKQLRLGGARPEAPVSRTRTGFIGRPSRAYVALTNQESPGSEAATNNVSVGGSGGAFAAASQRQKASAEAYKALVARRFAGRNGRPAATATARPGSAPATPGALPSVAIGANGLPLAPVAATSIPLEGGGRVGPSMTFPQAGLGQPAEMQPHFGVFEQPAQRSPYVAPQTPAQQLGGFLGSPMNPHQNPGLIPYTNVPYMISGMAADQYYGAPPIANPNASGQIPRYRGRGVGYYQ